MRTADIQKTNNCGRREEFSLWNIKERPKDLKPKLVMNTGWLTKTWQWRKQKLVHRCPERDVLYEKAMISLQNEMTRSSSNPTISKADPVSNVVRSATTGDFFNDKEKKRKHLRFSNDVNVVLIPTVAEYRMADFADALWWAPEAYGEFQRSALEEIICIIRQQRATDVKSAMKVMYQPEDDDLITTSTAAAG